MTDSTCLPSRGPAALLVPLGLTLLANATRAQDEVGEQDADLLQRVQNLETENVELRRRFDLLASERTDFDLGGLFPTLGDGVRGLAPSASKVYGIDSGLSIGGYGEALYQNYAGGRMDQADLLRSVLYFGYRFNDKWVFNSEIEFEHASTGTGGSASVEFGYLEYAADDSFGLRGGLLLAPMGFLNELHEPQTFLGATRPETESRILPSTWRELGVGVFGDAGPISYRAYVMNGFDGSGFTAAGLRGGRQKGSRAKAEDLALVVRADWTDTPGLIVGGSVYVGDSGQNQSALQDTSTTIFEAHGEYRSRGLWLRGLYAMAMVDDVARLNAVRQAVKEDSVGEELNGGYVELGYDVLSSDSFLRGKGKSKGKGGDGASLSPFVRYEMIDTQAQVPNGFIPVSANDFDVVTVGFAYQPFANVVIKLDYQDFDNSFDRVNLSLGYVF